MTTSRLSLVNSLRTRPADYAKDARMTNAYPDKSNGVELLRKRPAAKSLGGAVIGSNTQLLGNLLEAHVGIVGAGGGLVTINETSTTAANTYTSATKTTGANSTSITTNVSFLSVRGKGDGTWMYRSVRWRVEHYNGSSWVTGSFRTLAMGAQSSTAQTDSVTYTFPSAGVWQWRIYAEAFDTNTSSWGTISYTYSTETLNGSTINDSLLVSGSGNSTKTTTYTLPASAVNTSWEIYQIRYQVSYTAAFKIMQFVGPGGYPNGAYSHTFKKNGVASDNYLVDGNNYVAYQQNYSYSNGLDSGLISGAALSYNPSYFTDVMYVQENQSGYTPANPQATVSFTSGTVTIYRRNPTANSTTPANTYTATSYSEAYAVDNTASSITDATKALITVVADDVSIFDLTTLP